ncbi:hypothetical protein [Rudaea cellulosilytica]|uniref:hypothetical protein n=1 Tax=Rudaea cellulosilytica TaxID=540746 RepID=UPI0012FBAEEE|nr:hypothetical protein [Rudaea cellulosilytica]
MQLLSSVGLIGHFGGNVDAAVAIEDVRSRHRFDRRNGGRYRVSRRDPRTLNDRGGRYRRRRSCRRRRFRQRWLDRRRIEQTHFDTVLIEHRMRPHQQVQTQRRDQVQKDRGGYRYNAQRKRPTRLVRARMCEGARTNAFAAVVDGLPFRLEHLGHHWAHLRESGNRSYDLIASGLNRR